MRILIVAPPWAPVPPPHYGGIELVVDLLAVGFKTAGHDVTLFTTADSTCLASRQWAFERAAGDRIGHAVPELFHVMRAYERAADFDVVHDHTVLGPVFAELRPGVPVVTTVHGAIDNELRAIYSHIARRAHVVAVSASQAGSARGIPIAKVIHHGIDTAGYRQRYGPGDYLLYLGRISPDKGAHRAIDVARRAGAPLILAGKMRAREEREYFEAEVEPRLGDGVWHVDEVDHDRKLELLSGARALLFPIRWPEPFGLVMIEALASGTPVLAFGEGAVPEVVEDGRTGFICTDEADMAAAVDRLGEIDRDDCRAAVETRFSAKRMVNDHIELFEQVIAEWKVTPDRYQRRSSDPSMLLPIQSDA